MARKYSYKIEVTMESDWSSRPFDALELTNLTTNHMIDMGVKEVSRIEVKKVKNR